MFPVGFPMVFLWFSQVFPSVQASHQAGVRHRCFEASRHQFHHLFPLSSSPVGWKADTGSLQDDLRRSSAMAATACHVIFSPPGVSSNDWCGLEGEQR